MYEYIKENHPWKDSNEGNLILEILKYFITKIHIKNLVKSTQDLMCIPINQFKRVKSCELTHQMTNQTQARENHQNMTSE